MAKKLSPELKAAFRPRIRHIHLPDHPPLYAPRSLPGNLRDFLHSQITAQRYSAEASPDSEPDEATGDIVAAMRAWLRHASPPPTVLSFTRRPTYVLPKHYMADREAWEIEYMTANLKGRQDIVFPRPPKWDPSHLRPFWEAEHDEKEVRHNPLAHKWDPGVMVLPCAEPMYFGPGQISIWPVMDLLDNLQRGKSFRTKYEYERILENTTIQVLKREYGLDAFSIPGKPGVWVESLLPPSELSDVDFLGTTSLGQTTFRAHRNTRRIATVHADFVDSITRHGVSIHVGQPGPDVDKFGDLRINPWAAIRQDKITTSIVSELAMKGYVPNRGDPRQQESEHWSDKKSNYLLTAFDEDSPHIHKPLRAMPYSLVALQPGLRLPTPMGLDNRDLSTAWVHEFARQLGLWGGIVDHLSHSSLPVEASKIPISSREVGFMARPVMGENLLVEPYEQVEVPTIQLAVGGLITKEIVKDTRHMEISDGRVSPDSLPGTWAISWPLYYHMVTDVLTKSHRGLPRDTRLTQLVRQEKVKAKIDRRWQAIREAKALEDAWRIYQNPESRSSLSRSEALIAEITKTTQEMQITLKSLEAGRINISKQDLLAKTEYLQKLLRLQDVRAAKDLDHPAPAVDLENPATSSNFEEPATIAASEITADTPSEEMDMSLLLHEADEFLQVTGTTLDPAEAWTSSQQSKQEPQETILRSNKAGSKKGPIADLSETNQNLEKQPKKKRLPLAPRRSGRSFVRRMPTRAEQRRPDRVEWRMRYLKAAKLGPPKPKPIHQCLPTRRETRRQKRLQEIMRMS